MSDHTEVEPLTVEMVERRVREIAETDDYEDAHGDEDQLYADVLYEIARLHAGHIGALARAALKTKEIHFPRWCA